MKIIKLSLRILFLFACVGALSLSFQYLHQIGLLHRLTSYKNGMPGNGICAVVRICNDQQISVLLENKGDTDVLMKVPEKGFDYIVRYYNVDGDERIKDCSNTTCYAYALRPLIHAKCDVDEIDNLMCVYGFKIPLPPDAELLNEVELIIPLIPVDFARPVNSLESIDSRIQTIHVKAKSDTFE